MECIRQGQVGGGETHMLSLIENMDRSRFEPVVLSFTDGPMVTRLREMGIKTHIIHTERPFDFSSACSWHPCLFECHVGFSIPGPSGDLYGAWVVFSPWSVATGASDPDDG